MKGIKGGKVSVRANLKTYSLDAVRYAAYSVSGAAYVFISPSGRDSVCVEFRSRDGASVSGLPARFRTGLQDEKLREKIFAANRELREFMILKALSAAEPARPADPGLTPEQEKELDALISQVEKEISAESAGKKDGDPLAINKRWEERNEIKKSPKK